MGQDVRWGFAKNEKAGSKFKPIQPIGPPTYPLNFPVSYFSPHPFSPSLSNPHRASATPTADRHRAVSTCLLYQERVFIG
ncbi:hypothetical protein V6N13_119648 [Hibiscus sabdariffa]